MQEAFRSIMGVTGLMILLTASITIIVFLVWVIKLEFEWFFGWDVFKSLKNLSSKWKIGAAKKLVPIKMSIDEANNSSFLAVKNKREEKND